MSKSQGWDAVQGANPERNTGYDSGHHRGIFLLSTFTISMLISDCVVPNYWFELPTWWPLILCFKTHSLGSWMPQSGWKNLQFCILSETFMLQCLIKFEALCVCVCVQLFFLSEMFPCDYSRLRRLLISLQVGLLCVCEQRNVYLVKSIHIN